MQSIFPVIFMRIDKSPSAARYVQSDQIACRSNPNASQSAIIGSQIPHATSLIIPNLLWLHGDPWTFWPPYHKSSGELQQIIHITY